MMRLVTMAKKGFFSTEKPKPTGCRICGLHLNCKSPRMKPAGFGLKGLLAWAEAPGAMEDEAGEPLVGDAGKLWRNTMRKFGIDPDADVWKTNSVQCRPRTEKGSNRTPTDAEISYCRSRVWNDVLTLRPKVILLMGERALTSFLAHRWPDSLDGISRWRGFAIPDRDARAWVIPTVHPSYVMRNEHQPAIRKIFEQDIQLAVKMLDVPFPEHEDERKQVETMFPGIILPLLNSIFKEEKPLLAFDFETSGLKPQREGHFIKCLSLCWRPDHSIAFLTPRKGTPEYDALLRVLQSPRIRKTAHNMKFEDTWAREIFKIQVRGWEICTMLGAHILDNRPKVTGLKFQAYVRYGVLDYASHMKQYLSCSGKESEEHGANGFNRINEAPVDDLLLYCGMDSLLQRRLAVDQMMEMEGNYDYEDITTATSG